MAGLMKKMSVRPVCPKPSLSKPAKRASTTCSRAWTEKRRADNAIVEGFFGRLKSAFFHHRDWSGVTMPEFCRMLDTHLRYYNEERPKEKLGWMSPMQYRKSLGLAASRSKETSAPPIRRREGMRTGCPWRPGASASASCSARSRTSWGSGSRRWARSNGREPNT